MSAPRSAIDTLAPAQRAALAALGVTTDEGLAATPVDTLLAVPGMDRSAARALVSRARGEVEPEDETSRGTLPPDRPAD
ncbi:hypothetical protein [Wenxinia saemankumensis]|uniref:Helix-hairpin-helix domain-containing protein n=1 Tax=Wenxinia saemankumensis TaxID=1447782 RepID=A0A1M6AK36_9RHOB|nr:hypothetical protein [Wenxinia saemankumensis]SHI36815.1 hypothetical protein SAMN05444417_0475 [Wenxinia saemankumensis]